MQLALREGDLDALRLKPVPGSEEDIALHVGDAVLRVADPDAELQIDAAIAKALQQAYGFRRLQDARRPACGPLAQLDRLAHIRSIGNRHGQLQSNLGAAVGPVYHPLSY